MTRKLKAYKNELSEPLEWVHSHNQRVVFHRIETAEIVDTPDGSMLAVYIRSKVDLANPDTDIAALVGKAARYRKSGMVDPQSPELWYWKDKFWLKAVDSSGDDYYNQKCWLIYEVQVADANTLLGNLTHGWQKEED